MLVRVERMDHDGRGIGYINNKIVFVSNALPNELVDIKIIKEKSKYSIGEVINIIEKSPYRIESNCLYYDKCGGCDLMHLSYENELKYKVDKVKNILEKYACVNVEPIIVKSDLRENYRNKITLHKGNTKPGYVKRNSNNVIDIDSCKLVSDSINKYLQFNSVNEDITLRCNEVGDIVSTSDKKIIMTINNLKYQIDINSFFQVNSNVTSKVFNHIMNFIDNDDIVLDLYSGVGTLSILASTKAKYVYGIEVNEYSYKNALDNIILNKISNIEFLCGKVSDKIDLIKNKYNTIITDPPRSGMDTYTISVIKSKLPNKIIYMSCDPITLARDIKLLSDNYYIDNITLFDMFPNTKHVECVSVLKIK